VKLHPENAFKLPRWSGNDDDTTLYDLAAFLKSKISKSSMIEDSCSTLVQRNFNINCFLITSISVILIIAS